MARQFFSGNSLEQAVMAAARHFEIDPTEVEYTLREKKHGFVNSRRRFVIQVDPESPKKEVVVEQSTGEQGPSENLSMLADVKPPRAPRAPRPRRREPVPEVVDKVAEDASQDEAAAEVRATDVERVEEETTSQDPGSSVDDKSDDKSAEGDDSEAEGTVEEPGEEGLDDDDDLGEHSDPEIAAFLKVGNKLIDVLDVELDVKVTRQDEEFYVDFTGEEADLLTENDGKILQAIEQLMPRMVRGLVGQGLPCTIDCEGFKEERLSELREMAVEAADEVGESGEDMLLKPMNPADRRVVHMALADHPDVETESTGDGFMKRVRIVSAD